MTPEIREIQIGAIMADGSAQMRVVGIDPGTVAEYAEAMVAGAAFPPVIIFHDDNGGYWPGDGFHRIEAARRVGRETIGADIRQGNQRDAILFAVGANAEHGIRRTQADKRNSVETLLRDPEWSRMSDRKIAELAKVDHKTVARFRRDLTGGESGEIPTDASGKNSNSGEIPTTAETSGSMTEKLLATVSTQALIAECRRRGVEVVE